VFVYRACTCGGGEGGTLLQRNPVPNSCTNRRRWLSRWASQQRSVEFAKLGCCLSVETEQHLKAECRSF